MKNGTVPDTAEVEKMTPGQLRDLISAMAQATPLNLSFTQAEELIRNKGRWQAQIPTVLEGKTDDIGAQLDSWERHLHENYKLRVNCGKLVIPKLPEGKFRRPGLVVVPAKLSLNQIFSVCAANFSAYRYANDLDDAHNKSQKRPDGDYALWTEWAVEASEELANLTPDQLDTRSLQYLIIKERTLMEPKYFADTNGGHLDLANWTLTSSRGSDGGAFCASWSGGRFGVDWWGRDVADPSGRVREAVFPL